METNPRDDFVVALDGLIFASIEGFCHTKTFWAPRSDVMIIMPESKTIKNVVLYKPPPKSVVSKVLHSGGAGKLRYLRRYPFLTRHDDKPVNAAQMLASTQRDDAIILLRLPRADGGIVKYVIVRLVNVLL